MLEVEEHFINKPIYKLKKIMSNEYIFFSLDAIYSFILLLNGFLLLKFF